ncbi:MAG: SUMF1/EgtB/PvdO family nonheme iron enzyme [Polyangiaceae bacterium]|nr:SUMF1/EgtB/PvdO family nonheme iron enzyme [Polyangiaceae bacterium]
MSEMGLAAGTLIGDDFEIVRPLASGGMGSVFVARQRSLNMLRAVKIMNLGLTANPELRERFEREARISALIESDHVVQVIHAGIDPRLGLPWIAMELLDGASLNDYVEKNTPLSHETIALIWSQFCAAIIAAQKAGVVHRDIKPENVFLAKSRLVGVPFIVKVLDFGIAKIVSDNHNNTIQAGSPLYMAPEQMSRNATIANCTDVWAMGLLAFFLFVGKHYWKSAYDENAGTGQIFVEVSGGPIPAASVRAAEYGRASALPPGFDDWFYRCVVRQPEARFVDAAQAAKGLSDLLDRERGPMKSVPDISSTVPGLPAEGAIHNQTVPYDKPAAGSSTVKDAPAGATVRTDVGASVTVTGKPQSSSKLGIAIGAALAVAALIGIAVVATGKKDEDSSKDPPVIAIGNEATKPSANAAAPTAASLVPADMKLRPGMVELPGASFALGEDPGKSETLAPFFVDSTEVTVEAYRKCVAAGACTKAASTIEWAGASAATQQEWSKLCNSGQSNRENHPVNCVTWNQAADYCKFADKRLPTDAEWEYAARGSEGRAFPWGSNPVTAQHANLCDKKCADFASKLGINWAAFDGDDGYEGTAPVGSFPTGATSAGVQDLHGNVAEWTSTELCKTGGDCGEYVVRGGGCQTERTENVTMMTRATKKNDFKSMNIGFRCAVSVQEATRK